MSPLAIKIIAGLAILAIAFVGGAIPILVAKQRGEPPVPFPGECARGGHLPRRRVRSPAARSR